MRPIPCATILITATCLTACANQRGSILETPSERDIPQPVPVEVSLAGDPRPDIARLMNVRSAGAPSLSPDGNRLAFRSAITGRPQLWVVDSRGGWPTQLTFGESVTFHAWSPAGEWILYGTDRGGNEREGYYLIDPEGTTEREVLAPSDAFRAFGSFTRDGSRFAYATTSGESPAFEIHMYDVASGDDRRVFDGRVGLYASAFRPDGGAVLLTEARGEDSDDVYLLDTASGELTTLFQPVERSSYGSFAWSPDGSGFYLTSNEGREYAGLARHDLGADALAWEETPDQDVSSVALSHDGSILAWTVNDGGYSRLEMKNVTTGERITPPELPRGIYSIEWATAANVAAITVRGPQLPGDIWTFQADTGELHRATRSSSAGVDLERMVVPEHFSFPARDGVMLHGLLYRPKDLSGDEVPPVLLGVHGGPTSQARPYFNAVHQYLLTRGIAIFDLNYRGSTGYGKTFSRLNDRRLRAGDYLDMEDAVRFLEESGLADGDRAAVMGGSYGGYLAMAGLARLPGVFRSGVAIVGVSNWITGLEDASPQLKASDRLEYGDIDDPDDRAFFESISPIRYVSDVRDSAMVMHGANDPRCPVEESDEFVRGIRAVGGEVEYLRFPDEGHGVRKLPNRITAYRRVALFLERTLGVGSLR